ncbi:urotensin-2 receptor [Lates calcarifer]|uniref:Urotensin-2 receptor n=1 Tax=Lates calcarifer TaxID=8187 RepID=A0AAJ7PWS1_LATCA|nr:urotensin-2 receptor [Lates calcarifer]
MMSVNGSFNITSCSSSGSPLTSCLHLWYICAGVIIAVICLLGIPANIAVIITLSQHLHGSTMSQRLFFNLAVSDLLCLLCLPFGVVIFFSGSHLTHSVCQFLFFFFFFCISSDLNILVLISIQRYYQILHNAKWEKLGRNWQRLLLMSVWMLATLEALPVVFSLTDVKTKSEQTDFRSCSNQRIAPMLEQVYIIYIVFSQIVLLSFYVLLVRGVKRIQRPNKKQCYERVTKLFIRIIAVYLVVGFFPLILRTLYVCARLMGSEKLLHVSKMLTFVECFYFFNHCLNPFLYFFASRHYKRVHKSSLLNDNS